MKARKSLNDNLKMLFGKGKEYSSVAKETETNFQSWLCASGISEPDFLRLVDRFDFNLSFYSDDAIAQLIMYHSLGQIGMPLLWHKESGIDFLSYKVDAGLLLMLISSKCSNKNSQEKIRVFVRDKLRVK